MIATAIIGAAAYEIARRATARASRITPAQVYRVLDRLIEGSEVQRIELLSQRM